MMKLGPESVTQINLINWINYNYPEISEDVYHFANERSCSIQQGRILKRMGVRAGVSDLFIAVPSNGFHGLWIELKEGIGRLSKAQKEFIDRMSFRGYKAVAVWGLDEAQEVIKSYLGSEYAGNLPCGIPIC